MTIEQKIPQAVPVAQGEATLGITAINNRFDRVESASYGLKLFPVDSTSETMTSDEFWEGTFFQISAGTPAPSGAVTINVPAEERGMFAVYNNCGQNVTVRISGQAATPPTIAPGDVGTLISDGINVRTASGAGGSAATTQWRYVVSLSDASTPITAGALKDSLRMTADVTLTEIPRASLITASGSGTVQVDINRNGTSILSTKLTIDPGETTSTTAAVPAVITGSPTPLVLSDDDVLSFDVDNAGSAAVGLKVYMIGTYN
jgi:hypothetical protein